MVQNHTMLHWIKSPRSDLSWLISLNMIAFVGFHTTVEFNSQLWFRQLVFMKNEWLSEIVGIWGFWFWTLGLSIYLAWTFIRSKTNRIFVLLFFTAAFFAFWEYKYPVATAILVSFEQFERIGHLVHYQNPMLHEIIEPR